MSQKLTIKQDAYCRHRVLDKMSQRQAYIAAFGRGNKTDKSLDELASKLEKSIKVQSRLAELRETITERAIWSKVDMINSLREIADECKDAPPVTRTFGTVTEESLDSKARSVAVTAIKAASEILGYKGADVSATIKIIIGGGNDDYGG